MALEKGGFVAWEEHIISHERGNRVVHYYFKDASGGLTRAVVGTEKSIRHMIYVVSDEFLRRYGSSQSINESTKWRARRDVVNWLTSMVSKQQSSQHFSNADTSGPMQGSGPFKVSLTEVGAYQSDCPDQMVKRKLKAQSSDIQWSGVAWMCAKQLKHYPSFRRNATTIAVHSFVFIMAEEDSDYVGYLEDMYEDKKGQKKVKVRWFHQSKEVKGAVAQLIPHPREVFMSSHVQVISADCVYGPATILTPRHYEKCVAIVPQSSLSGVHMCFRQLKNNKVKPFSLSKLRGYSNQAILSYLDGHTASKQNEENEEEFAHDDPAGVSHKGNRSSGGQLGLESGCALRSLAPGNNIQKNESTYPKLKIKLSTKTMGIRSLASQSSCALPFKVDQKIELLCQDSGIRGCWFRCKVLQMTQKRLKVQYDDVQDADETGNLEEWVPAFREASPDKLGIRCAGRQTIRPCPPEDNIPQDFKIGAPIDAWWCDGWWEGVVSGVNLPGSDSLQVYLPGEHKFLTVLKNKVRTSRDWVDNRWVDVKPNLDVLAYLSVNQMSTIKLEASGCGGFQSVEQKVNSTLKLEVTENDGQLPISVVSFDPENVKEPNSRLGPHVSSIVNAHSKDDMEEKDYVPAISAVCDTDNRDNDNNAYNKAKLLPGEDLESLTMKNEAAQANNFHQN